MSRSVAMGAALGAALACACAKEGAAPRPAGQTTTAPASSGTAPAAAAPSDGGVGPATKPCLCTSKACACPEEHAAAPSEPAPTFAAARPGTSDGDYSGKTASGRFEGWCKLVLRAARFELGCANSGWQSAEIEYYDGAATIAGATLTLSAPRRYLKHGSTVTVIDTVPNTLTATLGKEGATATVTGDFPGGPMTLRRE